MTADLSAEAIGTRVSERDGENARSAEAAVSVAVRAIRTVLSSHPRVRAFSPSCIAPSVRPRDIPTYRCALHLRCVPGAEKPLPLFLPSLLLLRPLSNSHIVPSTTWCETTQDMRACEQHMPGIGVC